MQPLLSWYFETETNIYN